MKSGRYYNCARCQNQVIICRKCDRGNIYCKSKCSKTSRAENHRIANRKYQATPKGRRNNALRQRRYREGQKQKVTDRGSPVLPPHDVLQQAPNGPKTRQKKGHRRCHFCGAFVKYFRHGFLRYDFDKKLPKTSPFWLLGP
jgi:hypothetical protein